MNREFTNEDAVEHLGYVLVGAAQLTFAVWLLVSGDRHTPPLGTWFAYFLLAATAAGALSAFGWYFCWALERRATLWYLAGVASVIGAVCFGLDRLFALGFDGWDVALSFSIFYFAAGYGAWRLCRFIVVRSFDLMLLAVSEVGAAWRGELRR